MSRARYTCSGPVRGPCGRRHHTVRAAVICCQRDARACRRDGGAYSDRTPGRADGAPLTDADWEKIEETARALADAGQ